MVWLALLCALGCGLTMGWLLKEEFERVIAERARLALIKAIDERAPH